MAEAPVHVLIISGLDPSGGAGFIADVRGVAEHHLRPVGVITALTEQDTSGVRDVEVCNAERVDNQLRALLSDVEVAAVKIGMLGDDTICRVVVEALHLTAAPVVWDPIIRPSRGGVPLYRGDVNEAARLLAPHLTLITPNLAEAALLSGMSVGSVAEMTAAATALSEQLGCAVLITGGHLDADAAITAPTSESAMGGAIDVLVEPGAATTELELPRQAGGENIHGTGCALSTAIASGLASGLSLESATRAAKRTVSDKIGHPVRPGRGSAAIL